MLRRRLIAALTAGAVLALTASASAGGPDNDYQGRAEHDRGTYVGFDLTKKNGKTKISHVVAVLPYHCPGEGPTFATGTGGSLRVDSHKHFKGTLKVPLNMRGVDPKSAHIELSGKLGKHGKATGIIQGVVVFVDQARGTGGRCYTGGLTYSVKKGANVSFPATKSEGRLR
ncbi:hypothetical protein BH10ACT11_BH10ACT11_17180 [soil metagenome]